MKLTFKLTCILLFSGLCSYAQSTTSFGIKGALNLSEFSGMDLDEGYDNTKRISYAAGIYLNQELSVYSNIQLGVLYSEKGTDLDSEEFPGMLYQLNYLSLPLSYRLHTSPSGNFHILIGVQPSFLLNSKLKITDYETDVTLDLDNYYTEEGADIKVNDFDFSVTGGLGIGLPYSAMLTVTYSYGLMDVFKGADAPSGVRNTVIEVGFCFSLFD